jgi:hypothetical protein
MFAEIGRNFRDDEGDLATIRFIKAKPMGERGGRSPRFADLTGLGDRKGRRSGEAIISTS